MDAGARESSRAESPGHDPDPDLVASLEVPLPSALPAGSGSSVLCAGWCFHRYADVRELAILVDNARHEVAFSRMPRPALFRQLHPTFERGRGARAAAARSAEDPELRSFRSGFWGMAPVRAGRAGSAIELALEARLSGGRSAVATLGSVDVIEPEAPVESAVPSDPGSGELIAVCMATYDPDPDLFAAQVESLRRQSDGNWICLISDDHSRPEPFAAIKAEVDGDSRFVISRSPGRIGFYRNFERALAMVPPAAGLVALCDQDDRWYPGKLAALRAGLGDSALVYSDQRRVDREGGVIADTLWGSRRRNHSDFASLLVANTIVGASAMFRRRLLDVALPFPEGPGWAFHDHWLSIVALACGRVAYVDRPLYDYVQHEGAIVGKVGVEPDGRSRRGRLDRSRLGAALLRGRAVYFRSYLQLALQASVILLRAGGDMDPPKRRAAERLIASDRSNRGLSWLALRAAREITGRNETLGTEAHLLGGLLWRRAVSLAVGSSEIPGRPGLETEIPPFDIEGFGQRRLKRWLAGG